MKKLFVLGTLIVASVLAGCGSTEIAKTGDTVFVDYVGSLEDGTIFDTSIESKAKEAGKFIEGRTYEPLKVVVNAGQVIPGFDAALSGMKLGETKKVTIPSDQAYGPKNDKLIQNIPLSMFKAAGINPEVGKTYNLGGQMGTIKSITGSGDAQQVSVDLNHELAGKTLIFEITLKKIGEGETAK